MSLLVFLPLFRNSRATLATSIMHRLHNNNLTHLTGESQLYLYGHRSLNSLDNKKILLATIHVFPFHTVIADSTHAFRTLPPAPPIGAFSLRIKFCNLGVLLPSGFLLRRNRRGIRIFHRCYYHCRYCRR